MDKISKDPEWFKQIESIWNPLKKKKTKEEQFREDQIPLLKNRALNDLVNYGDWQERAFKLINGKPLAYDYDAESLIDEFKMNNMWRTTSGMIHDKYMTEILNDPTSKVQGLKDFIMMKCQYEVLEDLRNVTDQQQYEDMNNNPSQNNLQQDFHPQNSTTLRPLGTQPR
jgi:hypothetical protein